MCGSKTLFHSRRQHGGVGAFWNDAWRPFLLTSAINRSAFCGLRYFDYDFVGYFEDLEADSRKLLQDLGLYERYAASGWGPNGDEKFLNSLSTAKSATLTGSQHVRRAALLVGMVNVRMT